MGQSIRKPTETASACIERCGIAAALLLLAGACGSPFAPGPAAFGSELDLPRVGTLGLAPSAPEAIVVNVTRQGHLAVDGEGPLSLDGLREALVRCTDHPSWREPDGSSHHVLLVNVDASVPWMVVQWILVLAAEPRVGIYRLFFGARPRAGDASGAIGCRLPKDHGFEPLTDMFWKETPTFCVRLFARPDRRRSDPEALYPRMCAALERAGHPRDVVCEIRTPRSFGRWVPTGFVIQTADVAIRAGATELRFSGPGALPTELDDIAWLARKIAEVKASNVTPYIRVGSEVVGAYPRGGGLPTAQGLLPQLYGVNLDDRRLTPHYEFSGELGGPTPFWNLEPEEEMVELDVFLPAR